MNKQKGSAHVIIIVALVIALVGALAFVFWQNFMQNDEASSAETNSSKDSTTAKDVDSPDGTITDDPDAATSSNALDLILNGRKVSVDVSGSQYKDIVAEFDSAKGYYKVYSKDLLARVNASNGAPAASTSGCNVTVIVDTYPADDVSGQYKRVGEANGKFVHADFIGPCDPSSNASLSDEMLKFRDYIKEQVRQSLL